MTTPMSVATPSARVPGGGSADVREIVSRLRKQASYLVPFSEVRRALREAITTIERLEHERARVSRELDHRRGEVGLPMPGESHASSEGSR